MMLKNVGPEGEALVVLTQSEYDALVAVEGEHRSWTDAERELNRAKSDGRIYSWGFDCDASGMWTYFVRAMGGMPIQFPSASTRMEAAQAAAGAIPARPTPAGAVEPDATPTRPKWRSSNEGCRMAFGLQSAASCMGVCGKVRCHFPCEYEHDGKCVVIRLLDEEDPDAPAGDVDYHCDIGRGGHLRAEDERTKRDVQECWRRRLAMGEAFGVEP
jgi:hypothetical protein